MERPLSRALIIKSKKNRMLSQEKIGVLGLEFESAFFPLLFHSKTLVRLAGPEYLPYTFYQLGIMGIGRVQDKFRVNRGSCLCL